MRTREEANQRRLARCVHFTGVQNEECTVDVAYQDFPSLPCFGEAECDGYIPHTQDEIDATDRETARTLSLMVKGLSSCCEAELDTSQVHQSGPHKNHGPRFCSKCKQLCFMV